MKRRLLNALLCVVLCMAALSGMRMLPDEIEELMRTMNQPKLVRKFAEEDEKGGDPPGESGSESSVEASAESRTF